MISTGSIRPVTSVSTGIRSKSDIIDYSIVTATLTGQLAILGPCACIGQKYFYFIFKYLCYVLQREKAELEGYGAPSQSEDAVAKRKVIHKNSYFSDEEDISD